MSRPFVNIIPPLKVSLVSSVQTVKLCSKCAIELAYACSPLRNVTLYPPKVAFFTRKVNIVRDPFGHSPYYLVRVPYFGTQQRCSAPLPPLPPILRTSVCSGCFLWERFSIETPELWAPTPHPPPHPPLCELHIFTISTRVHRTSVSCQLVHSRCVAVFTQGTRSCVLLVSYVPRTSFLSNLTGAATRGSEILSRACTVCWRFRSHRVPFFSSNQRSWKLVHLLSRRTISFFHNIWSNVLSDTPLAAAHHGLT
jgi:hypothetical protein